MNAVLAIVVAIRSASAASDVLSRGAGATTSTTVEQRAEHHMLDNYDSKTHQFRTQTSAGVELYTMAGAAEAAARTGQMKGEAAQAA